MEIQNLPYQIIKNQTNHLILKYTPENHYYPFGLKHSVYADPKQMYKLDEEEEEMARPTYVYETEYQYKYNGKEWQDELGLNMYDMDMRMYDPVIARWVVLDPVTHHSMSPYNAFDNNPVFWADPSGASVVTYTGEAAQEFIRREKERLDDQIAQNAQNAQKNGENPPKTWLGKMFRKIGNFFGGGKSDSPKLSYKVIAWVEEPPMFGETETITKSYSIPENDFINLSYNDSNKISGTEGKINTDTETIVDELNSSVIKNKQLVTPSIRGHVFHDINRPVFGASLEPTILGMFSLSVDVSFDLANFKNSYLGLSLKENINLNDNSKSFKLGLKPAAIAMILLRRAIRVAPKPKTAPSPLLK